MKHKESTEGGGEGHHPWELMNSLDLRAVKMEEVPFDNLSENDLWAKTRLTWRTMRPSKSPMIPQEDREFLK